MLTERRSYNETSRFRSFKHYLRYLSGSWLIYQGLVKVVVKRAVHEVGIKFLFKRIINDVASDILAGRGFQRATTLFVKQRLGRFRLVLVLVLVRYKVNFIEVMTSGDGACLTRLVQTRAQCHRAPGQTLLSESSQTGQACHSKVVQFWVSMSF